MLLLKTYLTWPLYWISGQGFTVKRKLLSYAQLTQIIVNVCVRECVWCMCVLYVCVYGGGMVIGDRKGCTVRLQCSIVSIKDSGNGSIYKPTLTMIHTTL